MRPLPAILCISVGEGNGKQARMGDYEPPLDCSDYEDVGSQSGHNVGNVR